MTGFLMVIHVIISVLLCTIVLLQSGRGGGLTENFAAAGDMFGAQTSEFLIKGTTIFSVLFLITSLSLAFLSAKKGESLMANKVAAQTTTTKDVDVAQDIVELTGAAEIADTAEITDTVEITGTAEKAAPDTQAQ